MLLSAPAQAADSPWSGTWNLDTAKSQMTGSTFTISKGTNTALHYSDGAVVSYDYACDGKIYTTIPGFSMQCKNASPTVRDVTFMANGKETGTAHEHLSGDGNTWTTTFVALRPDGTKETTTSVNKRVSGTSGWFGTWKAAKVQDNAPSTMHLAVTGKSVAFAVPEYKQTAKIAIDGPPAKLLSPQFPAGVMIAWKSLGPNKIESTVTYKGKTYGKDIYTLSVDGKTITDVGWTPGKENEKQTYVYEKM